MLFLSLVTAVECPEAVGCRLFPAVFGGSVGTSASASERRVFSCWECVSAGLEYGCALLLLLLS